jgi:protein-S-isoprenylcysteine O-methyltransferase Ste14
VKVLLRALVYSSLFVAVVLVLIPAQLVVRAGLTRPAYGLLEYVGVALVILGSGIAAWCVLTFVVVGRGTPAPFDPPRRLVVRGPYRYVRNPMYLGAGAALLGAAWIYRSLSILLYVVVLGLLVHGFVLWYEEPVLTRQFGEDYAAYRRAVHRWVPAPARRSHAGRSTMP